MGIRNAIGTTQLFPLNIQPKSWPWMGKNLVNPQQPPFCKHSFPRTTSTGLSLGVVKEVLQDNLTRPPATSHWHNTGSDIPR